MPLDAKALVVLLWCAATTANVITAIAVVRARRLPRVEPVRRQWGRQRRAGAVRV